jgi:osmotically-inducible protein OsmY
MPAHENKVEEARADEEIAREIRRRLKADLEVPDDRILVTVTDGYVRLDGIVMRISQKNAAERCVREVEGVREISNRLAIAPNGP